MSAEDNKALFRRYIEEFWNRKNLDVADELFAPDATSPGFTAIPPGPGGLKQLATGFLAAFPDLHVDIDDLLAEGDKVVGRLTERATHCGEYMGIAPTGRTVTWTEIGILRIADGKVVESWSTMDALGMLQQLQRPPDQP